MNLRCYLDDYDIFVAFSPDDVDLIRTELGQTFDETKPFATLIDDNEVLDITMEDGCVVSQTAANWAKEKGRGLLSSEYT